MCQNCSFCDSLYSHLLYVLGSFMFSFFVLPKNVSKTPSVNERKCLHARVHSSTSRC